MKGESSNVAIRKRKRLFARKLRKSETIPEAILWKYLQKKRMCGLKFRRQVPIGNFIVDFCCVRRRIVIEVDGPIHRKTEQREYDAMRNEALQFRNYKVLRFTNNEIERTLPAVLKRIEQAIKQTI